MQELIGKVIIEVRVMSKGEMAAEGWSGKEPEILILNDGTKLYPSEDIEGNGPGCLFGIRDGKCFSMGTGPQVLSIE